MKKITPILLALFTIACLVSSPIYASEDRVIARLTDQFNKKISAQNPLPTDGDSIYEKDIDLANSSIGDFSGEIADLVNSRTSTVTTSADNPTLTIALQRPIHNHEIGLVASTGNFSNVTIIAKDASGATLETIDDSANNTDYTSNTYDFTDIDKWCVIEITFTTTDDVSLSFIDIGKSIHAISHLHAFKPDGTVTPIGATAGGNLKLSMEERDPTLVFDDDLEIARGNITGISKVNKYGRAKNGVQVAATDIWDRADAAETQKIWLAPTAARIHTIVSTSTEDDGNPEGDGVGGQAVRVWYLPDWDTAEASEDVILNGTAGVVMNNAAVIIHRKKVVPVGSTYKVNTGIITATAASDATVTAQINAGEGQTLMAIYGIPSTQKAYMPNYDISAHNTGNPSTAIEADFTMLVNERPDLDTTTFLNKSNIGLITTGDSAYHKVYKPYFTVTGPAIIKFQATATLADTEGAAEFDLILVDN